MITAQQTLTPRDRLIKAGVITVPATVTGMRNEDCMSRGSCADYENNNCPSYWGYCTRADNIERMMLAIARARVRNNRVGY